MLGKFITIEGTEGVGKTTNIAYIQQWLRSRNMDFITTREPGGTPLAEEIREILLSPRAEKMASSAELLLMFAGRAQHLEQVILPALKRGQWVICDRFTDATYAYQGFGRGMDHDLITNLETLVQGPLRPDFTLVLDIPVELGLQRAGERSSPDRFEQEEIAFFERVRKGYLRLVQRDPHRYLIIDASESLDNVQASIAKALSDFCLSAALSP
jgi:dTMP kinase